MDEQLKKYLRDREENYTDDGKRRGEPIPGMVHPPFIPDEELYSSGGAGWILTTLVFAAIPVLVISVYVLVFYVLHERIFFILDKIK